MRLALLWLALLTPALVVGKDATEIVRGVLDKQVDDWNRGDIAAFVLSYAENCTFVGTGVTEGRASVEQRYRQSYPTPDAMGQLAFSDLKIKKIGGREVIVTGAYHLRRRAQGGGDKNGIFSLVFKREGGVWHIVLDHTS
jgi:ketosteroid isomerase-like protein